MTMGEQRCPAFPDEVLGGHGQSSLEYPPYFWRTQMTPGEMANDQVLPEIGRAGNARANDVFDDPNETALD